MNWTLCTVAFRDENILPVISKAAKLGFDEVEIIGRHLDGKNDRELWEIRDTADACGIEISGISPYFWLTQGPDLLTKSLKIAERYVEIAQILRARMIRTLTDAGPTGIPSQAASDADWKAAVRALKTIASMDSDRIFALETHALTLADSPETVERLQDEVAADNLKLIYQTFNADGIIADFLRLEPEVRQVHLNPHIAPNPSGGLGSCGYDYAALLHCLGERAYPHSCALEFTAAGGITWKALAEAFLWCKCQFEAAENFER